AVQPRLVGLEGFDDHRPAERSGGMKKRAGIARALALDPSLLYLDEPSAGLDPVTSAELDDLIATLNTSLGMTTVLVTHELRSIFAIVKHCIMVDGRQRTIIARGAPAALRDTSDDAQVRAFFNPHSRAGGDGRHRHQPLEARAVRAPRHRRDAGRALLAGRAAVPAGVVPGDQLLRRVGAGPGHRLAGQVPGSDGWDRQRHHDRPRPSPRPGHLR